MNPNEYEKNVLVTESCDFDAIRSRLGDKMIRLLHAGLGLSSELTELTDAYADPEGEEIDWVNIAEETADLAWYIAVAVNTLGFDHEEISSHESSIEDLVNYKHSSSALQGALLAAVSTTGDFNDLLKKHIFYGRELNMEKLKETLSRMCLAISGLCVISGTTIEKARETNINKLRARYGDKFTAAAALNRDLETERKILENGQ